MEIFISKLQHNVTRNGKIQKFTKGKATDDIEIKYPDIN